MKEKREYISKLIIAFVCFFGIGRFFSLFINLIGLNIQKFNYVDLAYYDTFIELLLTIIIIILYKKCLRKDFVLFKLNKKDYINKILNYFILFIVVKISSSLITSFLSILLGYEITDSENQSIVVSLTKSAPVMMLISVTFLAPIVEEGVFRLSLRKIIDNKTIFILISGLIFGLMHIFPTDLNLDYALIQSITYVTMGFFLAYTYVETNNIWIVISLHALNNLISMLAVLAFM